MHSPSYLQRVVDTLVAIVLPMLLAIALFPYGTVASRHEADGRKSWTQCGRQPPCGKGPMIVDIIMDERSWRDLVDGAATTAWHTCDVVVDDTRFPNVGIRTKGDGGMSGAKEAGGTRPSLYLAFDRHILGQSCRGLKTLCLESRHGDAPHVKEALDHGVRSRSDAHVSRHTYARVVVNGNYQGLYLAVEAPRPSFIERRHAGRDTYPSEPEATTARRRGLQTKGPRARTAASGPPTPMGRRCAMR